MSEEHTLVPQTFREVNFYGDTLPIAVVNNIAYVAIRPIAEYLGLAWGSQRNRLLRDDVLSKYSSTIKMTGADGRQREMLCLQLEYLPGWLFGVTPSRTKSELAPKLTRYREECFLVLWRAFQDDIMQHREIASSTGPTSLVQVRDMALAIAHLAEQQIEIQSQVSAVNARVDRAAVVVSDIQRRLSAVERKVAPAAAITDGQATDISNQVKALAEFLAQKDPSKNHFQSIFGELYRRFRVSSYRLIRQEQYQEVLSFLEEWRLSSEQS
jgi:hypothetical protein